MTTGFLAIQRLPNRTKQTSRGTQFTRSAMTAAIFSVLIVAFTGCGGGSSAQKATRKQVRERAIASARLIRGSFAIAGIGRKITRSPRALRPRLREIVAAMRHTRDAQPDFDDDLGLYFVIRTAADGSGNQDLFEDASHNIPAGDFVWTAPVWTNGQKDNYPAQIHTEYTIKAGSFADEHGTIDFLAADSTGDNGTMRVVMTTKENERVDAEFVVTNGVVKGTDRCTLPDGTAWIEIDFTMPDGSISSRIDFEDGYTETVVTQTDGTTTETITGPDGSIDASSTIASDGLDSIQYGDGSGESVDVDTADAGDGGGSGDCGDDKNPDRHPKLRVGRRK